MNSLIRSSTLALTALLLSSCASSFWDPTERIPAEGGRGPAPKPVAEQEQTPFLGLPSDSPTKPDPNKERLFWGSGAFVKPGAGAARSPVSTPGEEGDITLNFENTDLREVVKVILGDLLNVNYILDPAVAGSVTMQTSRPLTREMLLPTLETLLRMNKAALVRKGDGYRVVPIGSAMEGAVVQQLGETARALPQGFSVRVIPLRYIGATEMSGILQKMAPEGSVIRVDSLRNLLVVAGTSADMANLLDTIETFDVDWMKGLSVGLFRLDHTKLEDVSKQLESLLGGKEDNPLAGLIRVIPLESSNSLLVVTPQPRYLEEVSNWVRRLDQAGAEGDKPRLYVYRVKHGDASTLAATLSELFSGKGGEQATAARVAPGLQSSRIQSRSSGTSGATTRGGTGSTSRTGTGGTTGTARGGASRTGTTTAGTLQGQTQDQGPAGYTLESGVGVVADAVNNSLLMRATPAQYREIAEALEKLDILPLQVLVEAQIIEIALSGDLQYGLQWYLKGTIDNSTHEVTRTASSTLGNLTATLPGFDWSMVADGGRVKTLLTSLASDDLLNVLSAPSVMVLDNRTARIQVGDEVPIKTQEEENESSTGVINSIEYRDTGVILVVTPRVTPGGLVIMDVEQEVSDINDQKQVEGINSPTIGTRNISSSVAVKKDQSVVLGGLIKDRRSSGQSGIPGLYQLPVVGALFGETSKKAERTELVVVLTPRVIAGEKDVDAITEEFRTKLKGLQGQF